MTEPTNAELHIQIKEIDKRLINVEKEIRKQTAYWAEVRGGRRVLFWILSGFGVLAGIIAAFWKIKF